MFATESTQRRHDRPVAPRLVHQILRSFSECFYGVFGRLGCMMMFHYRAISHGALDAGGNAGRGVPGCGREEPPGKGDM